MKRNAIFCGLIATVIAITSAYADEYQYRQPQSSKIRRAWYRGFMGYITLPIEDDVTTGWRMTLEFRRRIKYLEICGAQVERVSDDRRFFHLVNETWDGILSKGDTLRMFFTADTFPKVRGQIAKVHFYPNSPTRPVTEIAVTDASGRTHQRATAPGFVSRIDPRTGISSETVATGANRVSPQTSFTVPVSNIITPSTATPTIGQPSTAVSGDVCTKTCGSTTVITAEWAGNFGGDMSIPVTSAVTGGWTLDIWFENRVTGLQIWNARRVSSRETDNGESVYTVRNQNYNEDLAAGSTLQLVFTASIPVTQSALPFYVALSGQPECAC